MKKLNTHTLVTVGALIAIEIVLTRFCSIQTQFVRIGFGFAPVAVCAMLFGPGWTVAAAAVADVLGATLFPSGPFFPGFTVSAVLTGLIFGLCLYRRRESWPMVLLAVCLNCLGVGLLVNTFWLHLLYGAPYSALLLTRVVQSCILLPVQFIIIRLLQKPVFRYGAVRPAV